MIFKSDLTLLGEVKEIPEHKDMPQAYRASMEFLLELSTNNEPLLQLLNQFEELTKNDGFKYTSIDIRTHMLMKGMYPCIPGWHCDDFYRPSGEQPDLENVEKEAPQKHYMVVFGDCSLTEFVKNDVELPNPTDLPKENPIYHYYDEAISKQNVPTVLIEPNKLYSFGPTSFHKGSPASKNGWRTFIRFTRSNHRIPKNEIRYQSNVYVIGKISW